jgi:hypothetical protein
MSTITNVVIASKVPSPFRQRLFEFCAANDFTLSQIIRKSVLRFIEDYEEEHGIAKPKISDVAKTQTRYWLSAS